MSRKGALIIAFVTCLLLGIPAIVAVLLQPASQSSTITATLLAPQTESVILQTPELPALPKLPEEMPDSIEESKEVPTESEITTANYRYKAIHRTKRLFIRSSASMEGDIIGYLLPGDSGDVIILGDTWVYLRHQDIEGYVFREYLEISQLP